MPLDVCFMVDRRVTAHSRAVGDTINLFRIGDRTEHREMPATVDPGPPRVYTPKNRIDNMGKHVTWWVFVNDIECKSLGAIIHWELELIDADGNTEHEKCTLFEISNLPEPRKADLNRNGHTTIAYNTFLNVFRFKVLEAEGGGRRPLEESDYRRQRDEELVWQSRRVGGRRR